MLREIKNVHTEISPILCKMESIQLYLIILKTHETVNEIALIPVRLLSTEEVQVSLKYIAKWYDVTINT